MGERERLYKGNNQKRDKHRENPMYLDLINVIALDPTSLSLFLGDELRSQKVLRVAKSSPTESKRSNMGPR